MSTRRSRKMLLFTSRVGDTEMSFWNAVPLVGKMLDKIGNMFPDKQRMAEHQAEITKAEVAGGPPSILRLWRSFVGWMLALCFGWEFMIRPILVWYKPDINLPPSMLEEVTKLLIIMMGAGV